MVRGTSELPGMALVKSIVKRSSNNDNETAGPENTVPDSSSASPSSDSGDSPADKAKELITGIYDKCKSILKCSDDTLLTW